MRIIRHGLLWHFGSVSPICPECGTRGILWFEVALGIIFIEQEYEGQDTREQIDCIRCKKCGCKFIERETEEA